MTSPSTISRPGALGWTGIPYSSPIESAFGTLQIVWQDAASGPKILYVALPNEKWPAVRLSAHPSPDLVVGSCSDVERLGDELRRCLNGQPVQFSLEQLALGYCSSFQRRVLLAGYAIPRGAVSTYGRVARAIGIERGARAVGRALALNPFPIIIPCHRAVRFDGRLGGYRGGLGMKRALLQIEGVDLDPGGRVIVDRFYY